MQDVFAMGGDMLNLGNYGVLKDESVFIKRDLISLTDLLIHIQWFYSGCNY